MEDKTDLECDIDEESLAEILASLDDSDYDEISSADTDTLIEIFGDDFVEGLDSMANLMGKIHSLELVGIKPKDALDYMLQLEAMDYDKEMTREGSKTALELAKFGSVETAKTEI